MYLRLVKTVGALAKSTRKWSDCMVFPKLGKRCFRKLLVPQHACDTEGVSRLEWNGWQAHRQPEGNLLLRLVIWEAKLDGSYKTSLHNIGRPEIFRWIMRVMFLALEFSITKRNVGFRVVAKDDWWHVPLRTILSLRTVHSWSTNIHPSHRFASWLQPKSDQNFLRPRGRVKQMSTGGFFQSFRYVSLTVETSNES